MKQLTEEQKADLAARKQDQIEYVEWLNGVLAGRTIERVEMGQTAGWVLFHLGQEEHDGENFNVFLTAYCGGRAKNDDEAYYATVALHYKDAKQGGGRVFNLRDVRDPDQPAASAHQSDVGRFEYPPSSSRHTRAGRAEPAGHPELPELPELST